jgi:hypothetical protein
MKTSFVSLSTMSHRKAPVHILVIPLQPFEDAVEADAVTLGHVINVAAGLGAKHCPGGFRLVTNIGVGWRAERAASTYSRAGRARSEVAAGLKPPETTHNGLTLSERVL